MSEKAGELKLTPSGLGPIPRTSSPDLGPNKLNVPAKLIPSIISFAIAVQGCASLPTPNNPDQNTNIPPAGEIVPGLPTESVPTPMATESANYKQLDAIKQKVIELASGIKGMSILDSNVQNSLTEEQKKILEEFQKSQQEDINALFPAVSLDKTEVVSVSTNGQGTIEFGFSTLKFPNQEGNAITFQYKDAEGKIVNAALIQEADETDGHGRTIRRFIAIPSSGSAFPAIIAVYESPTDQSPKFAYVLQPVGEGFNVVPVLGSASPNTIKDLSGQYGQIENISYTITEPIEMISFKEFQIPKDIFETSLNNYANAFELNVENVKNGLYTETIKPEGLPEFMVLKTSEGIPLLLTNDKNVEYMSWKQAVPGRYWSAFGKYYGTSMNGQEWSLNKTLALEAFQNGGAIGLLGQVRPGPDINERKPINAKEYLDSAVQSDMVFIFNYVVEPGKFPKGTDINNVDQWITTRLEETADLITNNKPDRPVFIQFNEATRDGNGWNPDNNPLKDKYGENWLGEYFYKVISIFTEKGLVLNKDYFLFTNENGMLRNSSQQYVHDQLIKAREYAYNLSVSDDELKTKLEEIGINSAEDIDIILGSQTYVNLDGRPSNGINFFGDPTEEEINSLADAFADLGGIMLTEVAPHGTVQQKTEFLRKIASVLRNNPNLRGVLLWNSFENSEDTKDKYMQSPTLLFNPDGTPTQLFYELLR